LTDLDPLAASRMEPTNRRRVLRALEVTIGSGRPFSSFGPGLESYPPTAYDLVGLAMPGDVVAHRIAHRYQQQMADGFLDEARRLRASSTWHADLPAMRAVGYRQAWSHLSGEHDRPTFRDRAIFATRQLAKRQITWLRSELDARWFDPDRGGLTEVAADALRLSGIPARESQ
jgi:tRNA dimethylallyltransferase